MSAHRPRVPRQRLECQNVARARRGRTCYGPRTAIRRDVGRTFGADVGERIRCDETIGFEQRQIGDEARIEAGAAELDAKRLSRRADAGERQRAEERAGCCCIGAWLAAANRASAGHVPAMLAALLAARIPSSSRRDEENRSIPKADVPSESRRFQHGVGARPTRLQIDVDRSRRLTLRLQSLLQTEQ